MLPFAPPPTAIIRPVEPAPAPLGVTIPYRLAALPGRRTRPRRVVELRILPPSRKERRRAKPLQPRVPGTFTHRHSRRYAKRAR